MLQRVREHQWNKKNKHRVPAIYQEGDCVLVHHSRLPAWPRSTSDDPYFGPYKILSVDGHRITVRCSPRLGGILVCAAQHLKRYYDPEDLCGEEWELDDEDIAALDLQGAASPREVEGELPGMNAEEMAKEGNGKGKVLGRSPNSSLSVIPTCPKAQHPTAHYIHQYSCYSGTVNSWDT